MRKFAYAGIAVMAFLLASAAPVNAQRCGGSPGCGAQFNSSNTVSPETLEIFNKETARFREQLIDKAGAIQKEYTKKEPDLDAVTKLRKEMIDIRVAIEKIALKYGIQDWRYHGAPGCGHHGFGRCH